ncbi:hypothetical protein TorRG33x02_174680, partial [Trema orientale]
RVEASKRYLNEKIWSKINTRNWRHGAIVATVAPKSQEVGVAVLIPPGSWCHSANSWHHSAIPWCASAVTWKEWHRGATLRHRGISS